jgi:Flp pilus assembly protein TadG
MPIKEMFFRAVPLARRARVFLRSCRGSIAPMVVLMTVPLVGMFGVATEGGSWLLMQRAMQNAADSAVIAAATNGGNGGTQTQYTIEADAVTASYGFTTGTNYTTVAVTAPATYASVTACASSPCYSVRITKAAPLYLLQVLGYSGNTTAGTSRAQSIVAGALATTVTVNAPFCLTALGSGGITASGVPHSTIGCNIQTAGSATCHGHSLTSGYSDAVGTTNDCGSGQHTIASVTDPYSGLASSIPPGSTSNCVASPNGYYAEGYTSGSGNWPSGNYPSGNVLTGNVTFPSTPVIFCGDVKVSLAGANITTPAGGAVMVIENGTLDVTGTLQVQSGSGLTIIFTSPTTSNVQYTACSGKKCSLTVTNSPTGGGTLDISSPTSGTWSGMAIYQNPNLPAQSLSYGGNSPTWDISGIIYLPVTDFSASGAVNKSTNGYSCFTLVVNNFSINGTGDLFYTNDQQQCAQQGVTSPVNSAYVVGQLVY